MEFPFEILEFLLQFFEPPVEILRHVISSHVDHLGAFVAGCKLVKEDLRRDPVLDWTFSWDEKHTVRMKNIFVFFSFGVFLVYVFFLFFV